jgi:hypothetical protein
MAPAEAVLLGAGRNTPLADSNQATNAQRRQAEWMLSGVALELEIAIPQWGSLTSREENMPATFVISWERKMSVVVQYVVRPNPGTDPAKITELAKEGAVLWRKHGGKVTYWTVAVGEVGNRVLSITFENFAAYGAAVDKMGEDKEVRAWQAKRMKAGYTTWVRSNMATEIEI